MYGRRHGAIEIWPRRFRRGHLDRYTSKTPDIAPSATTRLLYDFWCHPLHRATKTLCHGVMCSFTTTEVRQLCFAVIAHKNVRTLDVAVQDDGLTRMQVL